MKLFKLSVNEREREIEGGSERQGGRKGGREERGKMRGRDIHREVYS